MKSSFDCKETVTILEDFVKTYVQNAQRKKVIIGLSGGVDSAVVAVLCQQALGSKKVECLFLPESSTPQGDREHKEILVDKFSLSCQEISITPMVEHFQSMSSCKIKRFALANIKARIRMTLLYQQANMLQGLVCGTSNKSELLIGYCTKYGDGGVDLQPIGDVYKTQVYELARYLGIPDEICEKAPTAGLWRGQTDEQQIGMCYTVLDGILQGLEKKESHEIIAQRNNVSAEEVQRVYHMIITTEHKRRTPLIPKLGMRTPGFDWRIPVQHG